MSAMSARGTLSRLVPSSLFGRLVLVMLAGLLLAQLLTAWVNQSERGALLHRAGGVHVAQRVADIARLLDSVEPEQRRRIAAVFSAPPLLVSLDRPAMTATEAGAADDLRLSIFESVLRFGLGERMSVVAVRSVAAGSRGRAGFGPRQGFWPQEGFGSRPGYGPPPGAPMMRHPMPGHMMALADAAHLVAQVRLGDGMLVTFDTAVSQQDASLPLRLAITLAALLATVVLIALVAVRWVTGPLTALAKAAQELGNDIDRPPLAETGPAEVRRAARAFNTMQQRLSRFISDRTRILAAMSHDLKTPITRMRLRTELLEDEALREKFTGDLDEMQSMVAQALDYMRDASAREPTSAVDLGRMLEGLRSDFGEQGREVTISGRAAAPYQGRPLSLRRCLTNLVDNALRYGGRAEVAVEDSAEQVVLRILDEGPGIPPEQLERAFDPFFRGEASRSRETGGTGLGLGIARNIARAHGGDVVLRNRARGGLEATVTLPRGAPAS